MLKNNKIVKQEEDLFKINDEIDMTTKDLLNEVEHLRELRSTNEKSSEYWSGLKHLNESYNFQDLNEYDYEKENGKYLECNPNSPVESYNLVDLLSKIKKENIELVSDSTSIGFGKTTTGRETSNKKGTVQNAILDGSAKSSRALMSTTNLGQQTVLPLEVTRHKSDIKSKDKKKENEIIPESVKGIGQEGMVRFLTAKVKLLTEQLQVMQNEEKKHLEKIKELQALREKSTEERDRLNQQVNTAKNVLVKYEQHSNSIINQLHTTQTENGHLKKEIETLKKEIRQNKQNFNSNELKLNRTLEEVEKLKTLLQQTKLEEKDIKESNRKKIEELTVTIKKMDKQRAELLNGFKKQLLIIDNLKHQKELIEAAKLLKSAENDFMSFLDSNPPKAAGQREFSKSYRG